MHWTREGSLAPSCPWAGTGSGEQLGGWVLVAWARRGQGRHHEPLVQHEIKWSLGLWPSLPAAGRGLSGRLHPWLSGHRAEGLGDRHWGRRGGAVGPRSGERGRAEGGEQGGGVPCLSATAMVPERCLLGGDERRTEATKSPHTPPASSQLHGLWRLGDKVTARHHGPRGTGQAALVRVLVLRPQPEGAGVGSEGPLGGRLRGRGGRCRPHAASRGACSAIVPPWHSPPRGAVSPAVREALRVLPPTHRQGGL